MSVAIWPLAPPDRPGAGALAAGFDTVRLWTIFLGVTAEMFGSIVGIRHNSGCALGAAEAAFAHLLTTDRSPGVGRVLQLARCLERERGITDALRNSREKITVFLVAVLGSVLIVGTLIYLVEGEQSGFTSIPWSVYWAIVTMTTVGYGDIAPLPDPRRPGSRLHPHDRRQRHNRRPRRHRHRRDGPHLPDHGRQHRRLPRPQRRRAPRRRRFLLPPRDQALETPNPCGAPTSGLPGSILPPGVHAAAHPAPESPG